MTVDLELLRTCVSAMIANSEKINAKLELIKLRNTIDLMMEEPPDTPHIIT